MIDSLKSYLIIGELTPELVERMHLAGFDLQLDTGYFATFDTSLTYMKNAKGEEQSLNLEITLDYEDKSIDALLGCGDSEGPIHAEVLRHEDIGLLLWMNELGKPDRDTSAMSKAQKKLYEVITGYPEVYLALIERVQEMTKWLTVSLEPQSETVH